MSEDDIPARIASTMRAVDSFVREYSAWLSISMTLATGGISLAAVFARDTVIAAGSGALSVFSADWVDTLLMLGLFFYIVRMNNSTRARTDGGTEGDVSGPIGMLLFGVSGALIASTFGDQWVLPGFFIGLLVFILSYNSDE